MQNKSVAFSRVWGPWRYNETVGWLEIKAATSRILGTLYLTNARITKRTRAKRIFCRDKLFEYHIPRNASPTEIYKRLKGALIEHVTATASLRGRFIDFEALDTLGPHIDWSTLVSRKHGTS